MWFEFQMCAWYSSDLDGFYKKYDKIQIISPFISSFELFRLSEPFKPFINHLLSGFNQNMCRFNFQIEYYERWGNMQGGKSIEWNFYIHHSFLNEFHGWKLCLRSSLMHHQIFHIHRA